ncbi:hypothetical protein INT48_002658 [Thamnidium elegans]|uniref:RRM domain-containing protein n=1 Tax=Thamnidium elegans TaxID=101142 RepID=A0A8H7SUY2_9FUNG|nr:hypothetical protein INT48_002658 [Thamnidium elegans]
MSDDFDDDLYNVYNGRGQEDSYNDEDLYGEDPVVDVKEEEVKEEEKEEDQPTKQPSAQPTDTSSKPQPSPNNMNWNYQQQQLQQQQQQQQQNMYQQYLAAYQRNLQQQMAMNPYQMQQMIQHQMRQTMSPQHYKPKTNNEVNKHDTNNENEDNKTAANQDEGKMFVGGLNWETTDVLDCTVMRDPTTQRSRGFGFLTMKENSDIDKIVSQADHHLDGKRRAVPRDEQDKTEKIFVGGISPEVNEEEFREFFTQFGTVIDATLMMERDTGRPRGFGFVTFESSNGVEEALKNSNLAIKDKTIEVKRATPKNKQNRMVAPVLNPNFRPPTGYMPNNRYTPQLGMMNPNNFMYGNMYGGGGGGVPYNAAAYYQSNRPYNNNNYMRQQQQSYDNNQDNTRQNARYDRKDRGGGGAIHASQSKNQQNYRPY